MNWLAEFLIAVFYVVCIIILSWWIGSNTHWVVGLFIGLALTAAWAIIYEED